VKETNRKIEERMISNKNLHLKNVYHSPKSQYFIEQQNKEKTSSTLVDLLSSLATTS
jgi:hypothetical protein